MANKSNKVIVDLSGSAGPRLAVCHHTKDDCLFVCQLDGVIAEAITSS